ncbi:MAG: succinate dehydrogenase, hydrophobic membrane anchor protein [Proteobacteria bacterium]|nr:succinate dehydrogenase, hydrophobic membrane anchor protein [Pseudomonadota bacterium]
MEYRSDTAKIQGLGSARSGAYQHIIQRVTALALIPLSVWFVVSIIILMRSSNEKMVEFISSPAHLVAMILMTIWGMAHGMIGIRMIIEDYVKYELLRATLLLTLYFLCVITALSSIVAALTLHLFFILRLPGI